MLMDQLLFNLSEMQMSRLLKCPIPLSQYQAVLQELQSELDRDHPGVKLKDIMPVDRPVKS